MGILGRIATLLKHLEPDPPPTHPLQAGQILQRNREISTPLRVFRGKSATDEDW
jgi:hypothetical protein